MRFEPTEKLSRIQVGLRSTGAKRRPIRKVANPSLQSRPTKQPRFLTSRSFTTKPNRRRVSAKQPCSQRWKALVNSSRTKNYAKRCARRGLARRRRGPRSSKVRSEERRVGKEG